MSPVETRIDTYENNKKRYTFEKKPITPLIVNALEYSFTKNQELAFVGSNVPVLYGFYTAHANHLPIKIKPDDIWLLIIQAFYNHVNENSETLRHLFVDFEGKKELKVSYPLNGISEVIKRRLKILVKILLNKWKILLEKNLLI